MYLTFYRHLTWGWWWSYFSEKGLDLASSMVNHHCGGEMWEKNVRIWFISGRTLSDEDLEFVTALFMAYEAEYGEYD